VNARGARGPRGFRWIRASSDDYHARVRRADFSYELPEELIAQTPLAERSASRLLVLDGRTGHVSDRVFQSRRLPYCVICFFLLGLILFFFNRIVELRHEWLIAAVLFVMGLLLYGPDSLISATAAVDFGTSKGASTASGLINGLGSIGAIVGGTIPGFFKESWGWGGVFGFLGASVTLGALIMLPKWNALPTPATAA